ncbi:MAG: hypothetical protein FWH21_05365 [Kiritimatiellaeota bacterium]|nr:hypothetical protein [Kiritimatiellota bacterium]
MTAVSSGFSAFEVAAWRAAVSSVTPSPEALSAKSVLTLRQSDFRIQSRTGPLSAAPAKGIRTLVYPHYFHLLTPTS